MVQATNPNDIETYASQLTDIAHNNPAAIAFINSEKEKFLDALTNNSEELKRRQQAELQRQQAEQQRQRAEQQRLSRLEQLKANGYDGYYEYKVISLCDSDTGFMEADLLSNKLNLLGEEGWHLKCAYANELGHNTTPSFAGSTNATIDQNILIFERFVKFK